jgi:hypothetical protein
VSHSSFQGTVVGTSSHIGGLIGINDGQIRNCYSIVSVGGWVGGLVGYNNDLPAKIYKCYSAGSVSGSGDIGGLVGRNGIEASINDSYSTAAVSGSGNIGGLVGLNWGGWYHFSQFFSWYCVRWRK